MQPTVAEFDYLMASRGVVRFQAVLGRDRVAALRSECERVYQLRRAVQLANGVAEGMEGAAHHVLGEGGALDAFVQDLPLWNWVEQFFEGKFILLNFGATMHPPGASAYTLRPHRDVRAWSHPYRLSLNMLVMLDDFTPENGATLFLPGSQNVRDLPAAEIFQAHAEQLCGKAGDILLFDSLVVHAAAPNLSSRDRVAMTLCFGRPFMKPQMDWRRFLAGSQLAAAPSAQAAQLLGHHAVVPEDLDQYYQPPERWTFKPDQR